MKKITFISGVSTFNIDETKIDKCYAKNDHTFELKLEDLMASYYNYKIKKNDEFSFVIKPGKSKNERYGWINNSENDSIVFILLFNDLWHVISYEEYQKNFYSLAEFRDNRIEQILE